MEIHINDVSQRLYNAWKSVESVSWEVGQDVVKMATQIYDTKVRPILSVLASRFEDPEDPIKQMV